MLKSIKKFDLTQNIFFTGSLSNEDVMKYMDASDIFFLPSLYEGISLSIFEAMAKELVIVATNTGGQAELVTDKCGFLIKSNEISSDVISYADAIQRLINNPALMVKMGKSGRLRVENFLKFLI